LDTSDLNPALLDELTDALTATDASFEAAMATPGDEATGRVLGELNMLVSSVPSHLDAAISHAAHELDLDRLITLMSAIRDTLGPNAADATLVDFVHGIEAIQRLRGELDQRVLEHGLLQRLDLKLRAVCVGQTPRGTLEVEWGRIKHVRGRMTASISAELQAANQDLIVLEDEIDLTLRRGEETQAFDLVADYFRVVGSIFRDADGRLRDFCLRLSAVSQPLKAVLDVVSL
jgi:hypothetical protein